MAALKTQPTTLALLAGAFLIGACGAGGGDSNPPGPVVTVEVTPANATVGIAAATQLFALARDSNGTILSGIAFAWSTTNPSIATVTATGQVTGLAVGTATITARASGVDGTASVVVQAPAPGTVLLSPGGAQVKPSSVTELTAIVIDGAGNPVPDAVVSWSSGNSSVATVRPGGFVTGIAAGNATITATSGNSVGSIVVNVPAALVRADSVPVPLTDLLGGRYEGFSGGLYGGSNSMPAAHLAAGVAYAQLVSRLDTLGVPSPSGSYVLLSIGMSNATQEWCHQTSDQPCNSWSFTGQAAADAAVRHSGLVIANGAKGGEDVANWLSPAAVNYDRVRDSVLAPRGLSEKQVQVVWLKEATRQPTVALPRSGADAFNFESNLGSVVRALRVRYQNLKLVFVTSRIYGGYSVIPLNPEPYAYETGLSARWLVEAQARQMTAGGSLVDPIAGDLAYPAAAPWVGWGPYNWANGASPRLDGLTWLASEFENDGAHPDDQAEQKIGAILVAFFKTSPVTKCWFLTSGSCP